MTQELEQIARECVDSMEEKDKLLLLANPDFILECEKDISPECIDELHAAILKFLEPFAHNYIECSDWHLLSKEYMLLADINDITSDDEGQTRLEDKFEASGVPWVKYPGTYWKIPENENYGIVFLKVPKWKQEEARQAFDAYYKWLCWKDSDFKQFCREIMYKFADADE